MKRPGPVPHGLRGTPTYTSWDSMIQRCTNPKSSGFDRYGGRGISVCDRWRDVLKFYEDMGPRTHGKTLDRIDSKGDYEPSNCRWATIKEQNRNTGWNRNIEWCGRTQCIAAWAEETGIPATRLRYRLEQGWTVERALTAPIESNARQIVGVGPCGETKRYEALSRARSDGFTIMGISACLNGRQRRHHGWAWAYAESPAEIIRG